MHQSLNMIIITALHWGSWIFSWDKQEPDIYNGDNTTYLAKAAIIFRDIVSIADNGVTNTEILHDSLSFLCPSLVPRGLPQCQDKSSTQTVAIIIITNDAFSFPQQNSLY